VISAAASASELSYGEVRLTGTTRRNGFEGYIVILDGYADLRQDRWMAKVAVDHPVTPGAVAADHVPRRSAGDGAGNHGPFGINRYKSGAG